MTQGPFNLTESNPWLGFAQDYPEAMFRAHIPSGPRNFQDYFRKQFGNIQGDYMGQLAGMALRGQPPSLNFEDFLGSYPFLQEYLQLPPWERGQRQVGRTFWNIGR